MNQKTPDKSQYSSTSGVLCVLKYLIVLLIFCFQGLIQIQQTRD